MVEVGRKILSEVITMLMPPLSAIQILDNLCGRIEQTPAMYTATYTGDDILEVLGDLNWLMDELQYNLHIRCNEDLGLSPADLRSLCDRIVRLHLLGRPKVINGVALKFVYCQLCYSNERELTQEEFITYLEFHLASVNEAIGWTIVVDGWCDSNLPWSMKVTNKAYRRKQAQESQREGMAMIDAMHDEAVW